MTERERFLVLSIGAVLSLLTTGVICYLAIVATESGERNLLLGGLVGTGAFGGGALFGLLGNHKGTGGPTTNVETTGTVDVNATNTPPQREGA